MVITTRIMLRYVPMRQFIPVDDGPGVCASKSTTSSPRVCEPYFPLLQGFWCETQLQWRALEDDELRLEEDVSEDGEADAGIALDATEADYRLCKHRT